MAGTQRSWKMGTTVLSRRMDGSTYVVVVCHFDVDAEVLGLPGKGVYLTNHRESRRATGQQVWKLDAHAILGLAPGGRVTAAMALRAAERHAEQMRAMSKQVARIR